MADGTQRQVAYVAEVTWGTTPSTPSMILARTTGGGIVTTRSSLESQEFNAQRAIKVLRPGTKRPSVELPVELSYSSHDAFLEGALFGTWTANVLKQGNTKKFFTIEEGFTDIPAYQILTGCMVNQFSLSCRPDAVVTGNFSFLGKTVSTFTGTPLDASPDAAATGGIFDSYTGSITEGGSSIATVTALELTVDNRLEQLYTLFASDPGYIVAGIARITGRMSVYFADLTLANKFLSGTSSALQATLTGPAGEDYIILLPKILYTGNQKTVSATSVIMDLPFTAYYDTSEATQMKITRSAT